MRSQIGRSAWGSRMIGVRSWVDVRTAVNEAGGAAPSLAGHALGPLNLMQVIQLAGVICCGQSRMTK